MDIGNTGTASVLDLAVNVQILRSYIHDGGSGTPTFRNGIKLTTNAVIAGCRLKNLGSTGITLNSGYIGFNSFEGTAALPTGFNLTAGIFIVEHNLFRNHSSNVINILSSISATIRNNSFWSLNASTGSAIFNGNDDTLGVTIINNIICGYSGAGGKAISITLTRPQLSMIGHNAFWNNTTNNSLTGEPSLLNLIASDVILAAAPFTDAANGDFSLTTAALAALRSAGWPALYEGAHANTVPNITIGALQYGPTPPPSGGGGGGPIIGSRVIRGLGAI
jgi:hypothetical protein